MAYDDFFVERVNRIFSSKNVDFLQKKMMGGMIFMLNGKMCVGVDKDKASGDDRLMARIGQEEYEKALERIGCREMDFTGKPMKGFVFIGPDGFDNDQDLESWIQLAIDFNPEAKASKKKASK